MKGSSWKAAQLLCSSCSLAVVYTQLQPAPVVYGKAVNAQTLQIKLANVGVTPMFIENMWVTCGPSQRFEKWAEAVQASPEASFRISGSDALLGPQHSRPFRNTIVLATCVPLSSEPARGWMAAVKTQLRNNQVAVHVEYRLAASGPLSWLTFYREFPLLRVKGT